MRKTRKSSVPARPIEHHIDIIRGQKVMLDSELAALYGVSTGALNQAVRRNLDRFPEDFMFLLYPEGSRQFEITDCDIKLGRPQKTAIRLYRAWSCHAFSGSAQ
jgi:hypothetical protein